MSYRLLVLCIAAIGGALALFFLFRAAAVIEIGNSGESSTVLPAGETAEEAPARELPLKNPPPVIRAIYLTGWTAGSASRLDALLAYAAENDINAMVVDVKDYSGYVSYDMDIPAAEAAGAEGELRIRDIRTVLRKLHEKNVYAIARVSVFQDSILAKAHPEWALASAQDGALWKDDKGLHWLDPAARPVWEYVAALARDAFARGFDEVNFDYVRFPSDGRLSSIKYPLWDKTTPRHLVLRDFFKYLREQFPDQVISADLFGLTANASDDLGIGQIIEDAYAYFDAVAPMIYPSHYAVGTLGYKNPAAHPYEVIKFAMEGAVQKLERMRHNTSTDALPPRAKIRPWLQAFDLGATYDRSMVEAQIRAVEEVMASSSLPAAGWLLWDPKNTYVAYD